MEQTQKNGNQTASEHQHHKFQEIIPISAQNKSTSTTHDDAPIKIGHQISQVPKETEF